MFLLVLSYPYVSLYSTAPVLLVAMSSNGASDPQKRVRISRKWRCLLNSSYSSFSAATGVYSHSLFFWLSNQIHPFLRPSFSQMKHMFDPLFLWLENACDISFVIIDLELDPAHRNPAWNPKDLPFPQVCCLRLETFHVYI